QADRDINAARASFELDKIQSLLDANARISAVKGLLDKHVAVSQLLALLESLTVKHIRFSDFSYNNKEGNPTLSMNTEAKDYNALASQSDIFSKNDFIQSPYFSDFSLSDNGNVKA